MIMSRLQLYTFQLCPFAHRVRLTLAEKSLTAELIEIDLKNKPAGFSKLSPYGKVPLLQHGEVKIWESAIINGYLDEVFSDPPLMPPSPSDRALANIWIKFTDERLYATTHSLIFTRDEEARRKLVAQMFDSIQFLEDEVMAKRPGGGPYVFGDRFTLVDITLYPWFEQLGALEQFSQFRLPNGCVGLREWRQAVSERKAVAQCARSTDWYAERYRTYLAA
jgi:glutathione S-transferase